MGFDIQNTIDEFKSDFNKAGALKKMYLVLVFPLILVIGAVIYAVAAIGTLALLGGTAFMLTHPTKARPQIEQDKAKIKNQT